MFLIRRLARKPKASVCAAVLAIGCGSVALSGCGGGAHVASSLPYAGAMGSVSTHAARRDSLAVTPAAPYAATVLGDRAIAFFGLNDTTTLLHDSAPNPKNGNHGSAETLGVTGLTSTNEAAAAFPGGDFATSRLAQVLPDAKFQTPFVSLEAWVQASASNSSNRYQPIVAYGSFSSGTPYQLAITPINQFFFSVHTATGTPWVVARTTSTPGRTFHIVGTYDGTMLKLYINGVLEGQKSVSGAIGYGGVHAGTGLAIGSGLDALIAHPIQSYAGTIADVSLYSYGLSGAQVMSHYLRGVATPALTERAASADALVDSIGVNAPFNYQGTPYDHQYQTVKALLIGSGIRHIRSGLAQSGWTPYYDRLNELGRAGIHSQLVTQGTETPSQLVGYPALVSQSMEAYEGPNEPDLSGNPNWIPNTRAFMQKLYTAVKGNPATARFPVMGPSVVVPSAVASLGNLSTVLDHGNIHPYYGPNNPGNFGTGSITPFGRSGSTQYYMNIGAQISGGKSLVASETGFSTGNVGKGNVSELCDGKEAPRTYFVHFKNGIARTLAYQFVESGTAYGAQGAFSFMGFVRQNLTPKPSYGAIKALIGLLSDKGAAFTTVPLTYTIRGNVNNLSHLLMQKRDGTYYLALWLEVPSWNSATNTDITAPLQAITVSVPNSVASGALFSLNDFGGMSRTNPVFTSGTVALQITDRISVLEFHP